MGDADLYVFSGGLVSLDAEGKWYLVVELKPCERKSMRCNMDPSTESTDFDISLKKRRTQ